MLRLLDKDGRDISDKWVYCDQPGCLGEPWCSAWGTCQGMRMDSQQPDEATCQYGGSGCEEEFDEVFLALSQQQDASSTPPSPTSLLLAPSSSHPPPATSSSYQNHHQHTENYSEWYQILCQSLGCMGQIQTWRKWWLHHAFNWTHERWIELLANSVYLGGKQSPTVMYISITIILGVKEGWYRIPP